ncbi:hypothetical protein DPMN_126446 [Dreissena polymorpha]|uniref:Uncharacterized protein n=1 Tax=Dreissena polymorpha TaxID=45954 RepID=A0A9D4H059_DREPO|nr:hypothetical protein DPMN_126446 [Dreissena polymorpha]
MLPVSQVSDPGPSRRHDFADIADDIQLVPEAEIALRGKLETLIPPPILEIEMQELSKELDLCGIEIFMGTLEDAQSLGSAQDRLQY